MVCPTSWVDVPIGGNLRTANRRQSITTADQLLGFPIYRDCGAKPCCVPLSSALEFFRSLLPRGGWVCLTTSSSATPARRPFQRYWLWSSAKKARSFVRAAAARKSSSAGQPSPRSHRERAPEDRARRLHQFWATDALHEPGVGWISPRKSQWSPRLPRDVAFTILPNRKEHIPCTHGSLK